MAKWKKLTKTKKPGNKLKDVYPPGKTSQTSPDRMLRHNLFEVRCACCCGQVKDDNNKGNVNKEIVYFCKEDCRSFYFSEIKKHKYVEGIGGEVARVYSQKWSKI